MFVYYFHVWVKEYLSIQWDASMRIKNVPDFSDAFVHFAMTSEVSHFPDPSDVPVLCQIISRRVSIKTPMTQNAGNQRVPSTSSEPAQEQRNDKPPYYQCGSVMDTNIWKTRITLAFPKMKDKGGRYLRDDGKEMCHTFYLEGNCASNCKFGLDHRKQSAAEAACLSAWAKQAFS